MSSQNTNSAGGNELATSCTGAFTKVKSRKDPQDGSVVAHYHTPGRNNIIAHCSLNYALLVIGQTQPRTSAAYVHKLIGVVALNQSQVNRSMTNHCIDAATRKGSL